MLFSLELNGVRFHIDPHPVDIAISMDFYGPQPNTYGIPPAKAQAFEGQGFVGDVRRGGSCNFEIHTLTPHCNGTHTECVGHIASQRLSLHTMLRESFFPATLVSIRPLSPQETTDSYLPAPDPQDRLITRDALLEAVAPPSRAWLQALVIRSLPNDSSKLGRDYSEESPPYFSLEAMQLIRSWGVQHLLVDMPSVDRMLDEGRLENHHIFWGVDSGSHDVAPERASHATITEMIYVPDAIADGRYLLELQVAAWCSDAAPSRPRLFGLSPGSR